MPTATMEHKEAKPVATNRITITEFSRDLWETLRAEIREQLGGTVSARDFNRQIPPWNRLPEKVRREKEATTRDELLKLLDRAGYEVRKKV